MEPKEPPLVVEPSTPDTDSQTNNGITRRGLFFRLTRQLRTAAHFSRAKRADHLTEPTIGLVVGEHELYVRSNSSADRRSASRVMNGQSSGPLVDRQMSRVSQKSGDQVWSDNRYILSHGKIHFWRNYNFGEGHPYIKVSHDVHIEDIAYIMHRKWKMESPRIVALIISNVQALQDWTNSRQLQAFKKGLMKAANSTNMWIFTNGINMGASRLIGDAVYNEIQENKAYRGNKSPGTSLNVVGIMREDHLRYGDHIDSERVELHNEGNSPEEEKFELNENHSHYIVIRDNTVSKTGINLFALRIIQYLSSVGGKAEFRSETDVLSGQTSPEERPREDITSLADLEIPIVSIVIQGGYDCARLVLDHLKRKNPVVVLRGSGGLADLLAFAFLEMQQKCRDLVNAWDPEYVESFLKPELSHKIVNRFPKLRDHTLSRNIFRDRILECVRLSKQNGRLYLTVLNMHNSSCNLENLSEYLLMALFKSQHDNKTQSPNTELLLKDLYLTLDWNCPHVAKNEVISRDPSCVLKLEKSMFETALTRPNREEFVDLFLGHGFRLHKFLTPKRLRSLFKRIHSQEFFRSVCWEGVLGHSFDLQKFVSSQTLYLNVMGMYPMDASSAERKALFILTMWAVFGNRQKLARVLWKHCDQPIHLGLVVSMMMERLSWYVGEQNLKTELKEPSKMFADYAIGVLDLCFSQDEQRANDVLSEESSDWNYKTAVDIAANARLRAFLAHPCCQKWLTNTFLGNIRLREMSWGFLSIPPSIKILLSALLVLPMYIWVRFKEEPKNVDKAEEEDEKDGLDEEQQMMAQSGDQERTNLILPSGPIGDTIETVFIHKPTEMMTKNMESLAKHSKHYSTVIRQRELLIKRQPPLWTMIYHMWNAPITKFWTFQMFYIIFLVLYSIALLMPTCDRKGSDKLTERTNLYSFYLDLGVCVWIALIVLEFIRRTVILYRKYTSVPVIFKCLEIALIVLLLAIYTLGRVLDKRLFSAYAMKVMLSIGLLYFYYRLFAVHLPISPTLGPLLYRLKLMITVDFVNFMRMALLVISSSGIIIQAITFPDTWPTWEVFRYGFHKAVITLFLTPTDDLKANPSCEINSRRDPYCSASPFNTSSLECPNTGFWPYLFSLQYFIFLKLVLMTLLYALFAATASRLQTETDSIWKFQRYILVVDFANRLPLPAPLNFFCYVYFLFRWIYRAITCRYCRQRDQIDGKSNLLLPISEDGDRYSARMSEDDYNFWRHLAREFFGKQELKAEEEGIPKKEWEAVQTIQEEIEHEKKVLRQVKGKVNELERLVTQSHVYLEAIKHVASKHYGMDTSHVPKSLVHFLARHSPYLGTRVQRVPVPDKYVAWEVMWIDYDPVAYSRPKMDFPMSVQSEVDEDILLLQELQCEEVLKKLPVLQWNMRSVSPAGVTIDRQSWIRSEDDQNLVYKLDNGIPLNPIGRTGLRGKGALPRWGPNHYVALIITRWQSLKSWFSGTKVLEFVVERADRRDQLSLPIRFIGGENLYQELQILFKTSSDWLSSQDMTSFFKSAVAQPSDETTPSVKVERAVCGYHDDPLNTDNAWKELELWHVHYSGPEVLHESMKSSMIHWRIVTEDVFTKLPSSQAVLMQELTDRLKPTIL